jgi:hypothetical protein
MRTVGAVLVAFSLAAVSIIAQSPAQLPGAKYGADPTYKVPRTADGKPDLQGVWANNSVTPMTRPTQWKDKTEITQAELKELQQLVAKNAQEGGDAIFADFIQLALNTKEKGKFDQTSYDPTTGNYNQFWMADREWDTRTSLIIDPPNGMMPPLTPEAEKRGGGRGRGLAAGPQTPKPRRPAGPEDLPLGERCLTFGAPRTGAGYNSYVQIIQSPETVVLLQEMAHDARMVPITSKATLPSNVRQWLGKPNGRWEGDTLVVETTNFNDKTRLRYGGSSNTHAVERFKRLSPDLIDYRYTITDPTVFTKPFTVAIPMPRRNDKLYEYACHEGNHAMIGILAGARLAETEAAEAANKRVSGRSTR